MFKDEQPGIKQLMLMDHGTKVLSISKYNNTPGTDIIRTSATVCVREIPSKCIFCFSTKGLSSY